MYGVFWLMLLVLGVDITLTVFRKSDGSARKIHAVFSGIFAFVGVIGAVSVPFALRLALRAEQAVVSYLDESFIQAILNSFDRFALLITALSLLTGAAMLWNGICRKRRNQFFLWCMFAAALQIVTLFCGIGSINAYFDAASYMNSLFLFEGMGLHLVNLILYFKER